MLLLQLSSAQGPDECCLAVSKALQQLQKEADKQAVSLTIIEQEPARRAYTLRSVLLALGGEQAAQLADLWCGTIQWVCQSPYRPTHGRKNWFLGVARFELPTIDLSNEIVFETMRSSGAGGQHVNKTDSAVRATHKASGISVKVQTERSQHANKRLAILLIAKKLDEQAQSLQAEHKATRRMFHHQIARGNPVRVFRDIDFNPC